MDRRNFLELSTAATLALSLPSSGWLSAPADTANGLAYPGLLDILGPEKVYALGQQYRIAFPEEADPAILRAALLKHPDIEPGPTSSAAIKQLIHDDFARGRTVCIDGWVLSKTVARQSALFSYERPSL